MNPSLPGCLFFFKTLITRNNFIPTEISHKAIQQTTLTEVADVYNFTLFSLQKPIIQPTNQPKPTNQQTLQQTLQLPPWGLVGIPLCEGSCALAGSVALVMILYGASQWLNYDLFGLFVAARQVGDFDAGRFWMFFVGSRWAPLQWS